MMCNPDVVMRKPGASSALRLKAMNESIVSDYFVKLNSTLDDLQLADKPDNIWNCDETGFQFQHKPTMVCARKGSKVVPGRTAQSRESVSVLVCGNAAGVKMPPMIVVKGKTFKSLNAWSLDDAPTNTIWTFQQKAWMVDLLGEEWFKCCFLKYCGPSRPQLLILDGHSSHESLGLLELANSQGAKWVYLTWDAVKCLLVSFCSVASTYQILTAQPENYVAGKSYCPFPIFPNYCS